MKNKTQILLLIALFLVLLGGLVGGVYLSRRQQETETLAKDCSEVTDPNHCCNLGGDSACGGEAAACKPNTTMICNANETRGECGKPAGCIMVCKPGYCWDETYSACEPCGSPPPPGGCECKGTFSVEVCMSQPVAEGDVVTVTISGSECTGCPDGKPCNGAGKDDACRIYGGQQCCTTNLLDCYCAPFNVSFTSNKDGSGNCGTISSAVAYNGGSWSVTCPYSPPPPPPPPPTATPTPTPTPPAGAECVDLIPDKDLSTIEVGDTVHFTIEGQNEDNWRATVNGTEIVSGAAEFDYTFEDYGSYVFQAEVHGTNGWVDGSQCAEEVVLEMPELACVDLTMFPSSPSLGDGVTFTCVDTGTADYGPDRFEFRYRIDDGEYVEIPWDETSLRFEEYGGVQRWMADSQPITLEVAGTYRVQCRVCREGVCTAWGAAH